jgi:adenosylmethionine-8-amino-7-oxononanoate aminotransferase
VTRLSSAYQSIWHHSTVMAKKNANLFNVKKEDRGVKVIRDDTETIIDVEVGLFCRETRNSLDLI